MAHASLENDSTVAVSNAAVKIVRMVAGMVSRLSLFDVRASS